LNIICILAFRVGACVRYMLGCRKVLGLYKTPYSSNIVSGKGFCIVERAFHMDVYSHTKPEQIASLTVSSQDGNIAALDLVPVLESFPFGGQQTQFHSWPQATRAPVSRSCRALLL